MPIFEYDCTECGETFEKLVRSHNYNAHVEKVSCPTCGSVKTRKKLSTFAAKSNGNSSSFGSTGSSDCSTGGT